MKLLILDNYDSFTYNLVQIIEQLGLCEFEIYKNDAIALRKIASFDKILLSPGPGIPQEAGILCELIEKYATQKSILGICLGHQAIAEVFGAKLINLSQVLHGISQDMLITDRLDYLFEDIPQIHPVGLYHSWAVSQLNFPDCLKISGISEGVIMALSHQQCDVKGIQFHPESIMTRFGKKILENWLRK